MEFIFERQEQPLTSRDAECANVWYESREDRYHMSTGSTLVGYPLQGDEGIVMHAGSVPVTSCNDYGRRCFTGI